jgi:hypothetical protein
LTLINKRFKWLNRLIPIDLASLLASILFFPNFFKEVIKPTVYQWIKINLWVFIWFFKYFFSNFWIFNVRFLWLRKFNFIYQVINGLFNWTLSDTLFKLSKEILSLLFPLVIYVSFTLKSYYGDRSVYGWLA